MDKELLENMERIKGKELKYSKLCEELGLKKKTGNGKNSQLNLLTQYCQLEKLSSPTRYVIHEVYSDIAPVIEELNTRSNYQKMFEAAIYQTFLMNNCQPLYLSKFDQLKLFQEVNDNFAFAYSNCSQYMFLPQYSHIFLSSQIAYQVLSQWTARRLKSMEARFIIDIQRGYRLYKKFHGKNGEYIKGYNVSPETEQAKVCRDIYNQAIKEVMPKGWGEDGNQYWVDYNTWNRFEKRLGQLTKEKFNGMYDYVRTITIIYPCTKKYMTNQLMEIYKDYPAFQEINKEACKKIMITSRLDAFTGIQRKEFIEVAMSKNPPYELKEKINENTKEKEKDI